jgi:hypothetical protein
MRNRKKFLLRVFFVLLKASSAARATILIVTILDESGFPATARVYLKDDKGESYFPSSTLVLAKVVHLYQ